MLDKFSNKSLIDKPSFDYGLFWVSMILIGIGLVMVYSSSIALAETAKKFGNSSSYFLIRQTLFICIGAAAGFITFLIPIRWWQRVSPYLFLGGLFLLLLVLIPGIGHKVNGSRRWLSLIVFNLQPSEFMKLFVAMYASDYVLRKSKEIGTFLKGFLPMASAIILVGLLLIKEPDFGALAVISVIAALILILGGINKNILFGLLLVSPAAIWAIIHAATYRTSRLSFLDPWSDSLTKNYQLQHSLMAFGRGEMFGVGLGGSVEKLLYLPEPHTDFILAVLAEELGFVGVLIVIGLFSWLVIRAFGIAKEAIINENYYSALLSQGIGIWFGVQGIMNMGVNMGLLPTKGLTLPLLSYGGSGILANMIALAILLRIDWENRRGLRGI
ncbi:MAG TPA: putative lipid II flippase FtsW [Methylophilaceae bacterium]|jgi:cell division protein FtsW|nr:putative lipid II flippase FtsW [Methylophilaceae bacterium]HAP04468.1 putative lipid II flippase FtsW [Methylophilaceae bacterium]HBO18192.1 putative lipid II flippase FtsW [Methylophilaceae bacterium]HCB68234.1 putative lipid II flippase FtsW [Methylophilaceae bacterium]HCC72468.1 putative lipid II flippase FtsW [Methylophilaceae bacterium]